MSIDDIARAKKAIELLKQAARELYMIGTLDTVHIGEQIDNLLSHDHGECGLIPYITSLEKK